MIDSVRWKHIILPFLVLLLISLFFLFRSQIIIGSGSKKYAYTWVSAFSKYKTLDEITNNFECLDVTGQPRGGWYHTINQRITLLTFTNGDWLVLHALNSCGYMNGGTLITRDNKDVIRVFFGHVAGGETLYGETLNEAYSNLLINDRREIPLDQILD